MSFKDLQDALPWVVNLPMIPKVIVSLIISAVAVLFLLLIWTPPAEAAVADILSKCYRRALITRTHAQLSPEAMFASIEDCRKTIQSDIPHIRDAKLKAIAVELLTAVDGILRLEPIRSPEDYAPIDRLKLQAVNGFQRLARLTGKSYLLPEPGKLGETKPYFSQGEANDLPTEEEIRNGNKVS